MMEFLYFPEDKSEYIPAILMLLLFVVGAAVTMFIFIKASRDEEKQTKQPYENKEKNHREH